MNNESSPGIFFCIAALLYSLFALVLTLIASSIYSWWLDKALKESQ